MGVRLRESLNSWYCRAIPQALAALTFIAHIPPALGASDAVPSPGIVKICSRYQDGGRAFKQAEFCGAGTAFVLRDEITGQISRAFVLTASHVSQGSKVRIDQGTPVLGRLAKNAKDLELIEVPVDAIKPIAIWSSRDRRLILDSKAIEEWRRKGSIVNQEGSIAGANGAFALKAPWAKSNSQSARDEESIRTVGLGLRTSGLGRLEEMSATGELYGFGKISPGMSGGPLVQGAVDGSGRLRWVLRGVSSRMSRDFQGSWFASDREVAQLVEDYLSGRRGNDGIQWKAWKGITYRDFGDGTVEINPLRDTAGGQTSGDGGGQTSGDGGLNSLTPPDASGLLSPGIQFQGTNAIALQLPSGFPVYADMEAVELIRNSDIQKRLIRPIQDGDDLRVFLLKKLENAAWFNALNPKNTRSETVIGSPMRLKTFQESAALGLSPTNPYSPSLSVDQDGGIRVQFQGPDPEHEVVEFNLDQYGHVVLNGKAEKRFSPVITVRGARGGEYAIDLRRLFFVDLSNVTEASEIPWVTLERKPMPSRLYSRSIQAAMKEGPVITVRRKESQQQFELQFIQIDTKVPYTGNCKPQEASPSLPDLGSILPQLRN